MHTDNNSHCFYKLQYPNKFITIEHLHPVSLLRIVATHVFNEVEVAVLIAIIPILKTQLIFFRFLFFRLAVLQDCIHQSFLLEDNDNDKKI